MANYIIKYGKEKDFYNDFLTYGSYDNISITNLVNFNALSELIDFLNIGELYKILNIFMNI